MKPQLEPFPMFHGLPELDETGRYAIDRNEYGEIIGYCDLMEEPTKEAGFWARVKALLWKQV